MAIKMAKYYLLALGFYLSITGSLIAPAKPTIHITDNDVAIVKKQLEYIVEEGGFTCKNYQDKCSDLDSQIERICLVAMKKYICNRYTDLEGIKLIMMEVNSFDRAFAVEYLDNLRAVNKIIQQQELKKNQYHSHDRT